MRGGGYEQEYPFVKFPKYNWTFKDEPLKYSDLQPIKSFYPFLYIIHQLLHNLGSTKEKSYKEFFKILICKYYDEKEHCNDDEPLSFQVGKDLQTKMQELYEKANKYYKLDLDDEFNLHNETLIKIVKLLEQYTLLESRQEVLQALFMKYAESTLKTELSQFYTPIDIIEFIVGMLVIGNMTTVIDPAGGSGDFLIGALKKNKNIRENLYYFDCSPEACKVAKMNMILNGDGKTNIYEKDSIAEFDIYNERFDLVITNPPFGTQTIFNGSDDILEQYDIFKYFKSGKSKSFDSKDNQGKRLGVLFIERSLKLLKNNGILCIILPNGYLNNPSDVAIRKFLLNYRIVAYISLPEGVFKGSNTGVKTGILVVKKEKMENDYRIFTAVANDVGFDFHKKTLDRLYQRDENNGTEILDTDNNKIPLSDFPLILQKFKQFIFDNNISGFEKENTNMDYAYITRNNFLKNLILRAESNEFEYISTINKIKSQDYFTLLADEITNKKEVKKISHDDYIYLDIGNIGYGSYRLDNILKGWQLPNRAAMNLQKYDICISKLKGSLESFAMILHDNAENFILTNGCYRIRIDDEVKRLSFYGFLFSQDYLIQMKALATGSIMLDVKENDLCDIVFPKLSDYKLHAIKNYINSSREFINLNTKLFNS
ncbi:MULTISPECIES: HsdM family class I SAM-dependent methyltransferase [unclassified Campylobacter]|uniref:HsdM family class I SAM-dependent methyltransferase n=1 Tax=unclassified Campylobacter TaxID=2593542 RepID=UPI0022EA0588|nr:MULTISPECIES: N-6 DNA methylase [unclassified Campylobacter]MDA3053791.1 N-6 DNA methylase [Campylobacter sp. VBCF_07 NA4]MDA3060320.1 N-6 DNA methylase [Campylobacter sp. VBCF_02 NA5]MDA3069830.1 N-6 DNA methylase [Campylobacter sp. VBCF_08 NA3]WBR54843.1 N-6 DNA methylase [Campylobacter sp. VBCF_01 NA2]